MMGWGVRSHALDSPCPDSRADATKRRGLSLHLFIPSSHHLFFIPGGGMLLSQLLRPNDICLNVKSARKLDAIKEIVDKLASNGRTIDKVRLFEAILEREELQTTAISSGVALPHARIDAALPHAKTDAVDNIIMGLGISQQGIDFGAADHTPAHLVFLIAAPKTSNTEYLNILQSVCKLLESPGFREKLMVARTAEDVVEAIREGEELRADKPNGAGGR